MSPSYPRSARRFASLWRGSLSRAGSLARCAGALACLLSLAIVARVAPRLASCLFAFGAGPSAICCRSCAAFDQVAWFCCVGGAPFLAWSFCFLPRFLGHLRAFRLVRSGVWPARRLARFAGSPGPLLLFPLCFFSVPRVSEVRTCCFMRVSSV